MAAKPWEMDWGAQTQAPPAPTAPQPVSTLPPIAPAPPKPQPRPLTRAMDPWVRAFGGVPDISKAFEDAPADEPSFGTVAEHALQRALSGSAQTAQTVGTGKPGAELIAPSTFEQEPITLKGIIESPVRSLKHVVGQTVESSPTLGLGLAGGALGAEAGPIGAVVGGAAGMGLGNLIQTLGPNYAAALQKYPGDPEAAYREAVRVTAIGTGGTVVSGLLLGVNPFSSRVKGMLAQVFGVQPVAMSATAAGEQLARGETPTVEGALEAYPGQVAGGLGIVGVGEAIHAVTPARTAPVPRQEPTVDMPGAVTNDPLRSVNPAVRAWDAPDAAAPAKPGEVAPVEIPPEAEAIIAGYEKQARNEKHSEAARARFAARAEELRARFAPDDGATALTPRPQQETPSEPSVLDRPSLPEPARALALPPPGVKPWDHDWDTAATGAPVETQPPAGEASNLPPGVPQTSAFTPPTQARPEAQAAIAAETPSPIDAPPAAGPLKPGARGADYVPPSIAREQALRKNYRPTRLAGWLKNRGGLREARGELAHMGAKRVRGLVHSRGMHPDDAALAAQEAGYLPRKYDENGDLARADMNDLFEALASDLNSRPVYSEDDFQHLEEANRRRRDRGAKSSAKVREGYYGEAGGGDEIELPPFQRARDEENHLAPFDSGHFMEAAGGDHAQAVDAIRARLAAMPEEIHGRPSQYRLKLEWALNELQDPKRATLALVEKPLNGNYAKPDLRSFAISRAGREIGRLFITGKGQSFKVENVAIQHGNAPLSEAETALAARYLKARLAPEDEATPQPGQEPTGAVTIRDVTPEGNRPANFRHFTIYNQGREIGHFSGQQTPGGNFHIWGMAGTDARGEIPTSVMREALRQVQRELAPEGNLTGQRVGGARRGPAADPNTSLIGNVSGRMRQAGRDESERPRERRPTGREMPRRESGQYYLDGRPWRVPNDDSAENGAHMWLSMRSERTLPETMKALRDLIDSTVSASSRRLYGRALKWLRDNQYRISSEPDENASFEAPVRASESEQGKTEAERLLGESGIPTRLRQAARDEPTGQLVGPGKAFYSQVEHWLERLPMKKASGQQWLATLKQRPGIKADELEATGLADWLNENRDRAITKAEVQQHLDDNAVRLEETTLGGDDALRSDLEKRMDEAQGRAIQAREEFNAAARRLRPQAEEFHSVSSSAEWVTQYAPELQPQIEAWGNAEDAARMWGERFDMASNNAERRGTKFEQYTEPGGTNYREMLLRLPAGENTAEYQRLAAERKRIASSGTWGEVRDQLDATDRQLEQIKGQAFTTHHFSEPNILAHIRLKDRVGPKGEKILHVEEIQSDWHQQGRARGYNTEDAKAARIKAMDAHDAARAETKRVTDQITQAKARGATDAELAPLRRSQDLSIQREGEAYRASQAGEVPDAPFKNTWHELALKRVLDLAAREGYDEVAWTPGKLQAERYGLEKHVGRIKIVEMNRPPNATYSLEAFKLHDTNQVVAQEHNLTVEQLREHVGAEVAERALAQIEEGKKRPVPYYAADLRGHDLKIGGAGFHRTLYDQKVPQVLNAFGKRFGGRVGKTEFEAAEKESSPAWYSMHGGFGREFWLERHTHYSGPMVAGERVPGTFKSYAEADDARQNFQRRERAGIVEFPSFKITDAMREALAGGQPLFQKRASAATEMARPVSGHGRNIMAAGGPGNELAIIGLNAEEASRYHKLVAVTHQIFRKLAPAIDATAARSIEMEHRGQNLEAHGVYSEDFSRPLVAWAMEGHTAGGTKYVRSPANVITTVRHEAIHALYRGGFFKRREWEALERAAVKGDWLQKHDIHIDYADQTRRVQIEEAIAEEFGTSRPNNFAEHKGIVRAVFQRMHSLLTQIKAAASKLIGQGDTAANVMRKIESGQVGARRPGTREGGNFAAQKAREVAPAHQTYVDELNAAVKSMAQTNAVLDRIRADNSVGKVEMLAIAQGAGLRVSSTTTKDQALQYLAGRAGQAERDAALHERIRRGL